MDRALGISTPSTPAVLPADRNNLKQGQLLLSQYTLYASARCWKRVLKMSMRHMFEIKSICLLLYINAFEIFFFWDLGSLISKRLFEEKRSSGNRDKIHDADNWDFFLEQMKPLRPFQQLANSEVQIARKVLWALSQVIEGILNFQWVSRFFLSTSKTGFCLLWLNTGQPP